MEYHIRFDDAQQALILLDQRLLPLREEFFTCRSVEDIVYALQEMVVRGAPAIGVCAAWGCVLAAGHVRERFPGSVSLNASEAGDRDAPAGILSGLLDALACARPTAVNLSWAVQRMRDLWRSAGPVEPDGLVRLWKEEAARLQAGDIAANKQMGAFGAELLESGDTVMTHCNAGALATAGFGTALGVIYAARLAGKDIRVIANETRPFLQGARLTAYELHKEGVPVTLACDNACAFLMKQGMVHKVVTGADRIAANGDTANKIGTYGVALLARAHGIPFYIAAPLSTIDPSIPEGGRIPIEERTPLEVTHMQGAQITPDGVPVFNYAFDVTPAELISGIITEKGVLRPPYPESIAAALALPLEGQKAYIPFRNGDTP